MCNGFRGSIAMQCSYKESVSPSLNHYIVNLYCFSCWLTLPVPAHNLYDNQLILRLLFTLVPSHWNRWSSYPNCALFHLSDYVNIYLYAVVYITMLIQSACDWPHQQLPISSNIWAPNRRRLVCLSNLKKWPDSNCPTVYSSFIYL